MPIEPETVKGKANALAKLKERRENKPKRIDNSSLHAGAPMYFYCIACGWVSDTLPETFTSRPRKLCGECQAMKDLGWLE